MRAVLTMVLLLAHAPAHAEWVLVGSSSGGERQFYIDPATIRLTGQFRRVWSMVSFKKKDPDGMLSGRSLHEYDCKDERYRILSMTSFSETMLGGSIISTFDEPGKWSYIAPDTVALTILREVCAK